MIGPQCTCGGSHGGPTDDSAAPLNPAVCTQQQSHTPVRESAVFLGWVSFGRETNEICFPGGPNYVVTNRISNSIFTLIAKIHC